MFAPLLRKLKGQIREAISDSFHDIIYNSPFIDREKIIYPPETWDEETKEKFDLLTELELNLQEHIEGVYKNLES